MTPIRIGLDIAKNVFHAHGVDDKGTVVIRKRLRRPDILRRILPEARIAMRAVADQLCDLQTRIKEIEQAIQAWHRSNDASRRLATIPGVGSITASAIVATVANASEVKSARHFAAFLGLTPRQRSTGADSASAASRSKEMSTSAAF